MTAAVGIPATGFALQTRDLAVGYRSRRTRRIVLEHLDLAVRPGELVCLLGANGAGKSTFLRTIARMQPPLAGAVELGGRSLDTLSQVDLARRLGVVLTERIVVGALQAGRLVELGRYPHLGWFGALGSGDRDVVQRAIDAVGAAHLASRDISTLSDGERQRFMIARALAQEPLVLLLDEPTAFLDVPSRVELMGLLQRLARGAGVAVVVSTHDLELALRMADTVWLVMPDGRVRADAPEDIVLSGDVARAFAGVGIDFRPEERVFRVRHGTKGNAAVSGDGIGAALARAVLEREGYAVDADGSGDLFVRVNEGAAAWEASVHGRTAQGESFGELAAWIRSEESR